MRTKAVWRSAKAFGCALLLAVPAAEGAEARPAGKDAPIRAATLPSVVQPATGKASAKPGLRPAHASESGTRRAIPAGPAADDVSMGAESPDLHALRDAERELFPLAASGSG